MDGNRLDVSVSDTAVDFELDYLYDMDYTPAACVPIVDSTGKNAGKMIPCRNRTTTGFSFLSNSDTPDFRVKFGYVEQPMYYKGYLVIAELLPIDENHLRAGGARSYFDGVDYIFCFDSMARIVNYKRLDPEE